MGRPREDPRESVRAECRVARAPRPRCRGHRWQLSCSWGPLQSRCCMTKTVNPIQSNVLLANGQCWRWNMGQDAEFIFRPPFPIFLQWDFYEFYDAVFWLSSSDNHILRWKGEPCRGLGQPQGPSSFMHSRSSEEEFLLCTFGHPGDRLWRSQNWHSWHQPYSRRWRCKVKKRTTFSHIWSNANDQRRPICFHMPHW